MIKMESPPNHANDLASTDLDLNAEYQHAASKLNANPAAASSEVTDDDQHAQNKSDDDFLSQFQVGIPVTNNHSQVTQLYDPQTQESSDEDYYLIENKRAKSSVWQNFTVQKRRSDGKIRENRAICNYCSAIVKCCGGTTNLSCHLRRHHPDVNPTNIFRIGPPQGDNDSPSSPSSPSTRSLPHKSPSASSSSHSRRHSSSRTGTFKVKAGLAQMAKGGIIMDVTTAAEARIAEEAGACAVMALERVPADIRRDGGVARMTDPKIIKEIMAAVSIPVMAKVRIGHFAEGQILQSLGVDMIDESEVLTPVDKDNYVDKWAFTVPFVCGARDLGEALRRISEGAAMIRTKGHAGTGDVAEAVKHARAINAGIKAAQAADHTQIYGLARDMRVDVGLLQKTAQLGRLPVVNFAAGGLATPADVSLLMQLGVDGVFVGSGIFKSSCPVKRASAMAQAVSLYNDPDAIAQLSEDLGQAMFGDPQDKKGKKSEGSEGKGSIWDSTLGDKK